MTAAHLRARLAALREDPASKAASGLWIYSAKARRAIRRYEVAIMQADIAEGIAATAAATAIAIDAARPKCKLGRAIELANRRNAPPGGWSDADAVPTCGTGPGEAT